MSVWQIFWVIFIWESCFIIIEIIFFFLSLHKAHGKCDCNLKTATSHNAFRWLCYVTAVTFLLLAAKELYLQNLSNAVLVCSLYFQLLGLEIRIKELRVAFAEEGTHALRFARIWEAYWVLFYLLQLFFSERHCSFDAVKLFSSPTSSF